VRADPGTQLRGLILFLGLALLGLLPLAWRHAPWPAPALSPRRRALLLGALFLLPLALFYAITLVRPLYADRYLIVVTPAFILLTAGGLLALERFFRPLSLIAIALILATSWAPLRDVNLAATAQKEDWRTAYEYIAAHAHPNDAIVVHPGYLDTTLDYYRLRDGANSPLRALPLLTIPADLTDGTQGDRSKDLLDQYLQKATAGYERVWLVLSPDRLSPQDPHDLLRDWYTYNGRLIEERQLNGVWLGLYTSRLYGLPYYPPVPIRLDQPIGASGVTLVGYGYDLPPGASSVQAGMHLPLVLRWQFASPDVGQFAIRWHLLDQRGAPVPDIGGSEPLLGNHPLRSWDRPIETWDYHDLALPASLPPGDYRLVIAVTPAAHTDQALAPGALTLGWFTVR
jgi:hypothetical protein